jgi:hypothetical protein
MTLQFQGGHQWRGVGDPQRLDCTEHMTTTSSMDSTRGAKRFPWGWLAFIASALAIPVCYRLGASLSGENHFGQGLKGSWYWALFWTVQTMSLFGFVLSPCLSVKTERRQGLLMVIAFVAFLFDEFLSFAFIAFGMFPD